MRRDRYVVGYRGERQVVYGKDEEFDDGLLFASYTSPLTLHQAKKRKRSMPERGAAVYKLVEFQDE